MKHKTLIKKLNLKEEDFEAIKKAVQDAEKTTSGEIAVAIAPESSNYSFWELFASNCAALVLLAIIIPFTDKITALYNMIYWQNQPTWMVPLFYVVSAFAAILIFFYLTNIPAIDKLIIPRSVKRISVTNRAFRYFTESGVYNTKEHSGVLIYVSYMEKQVRIIADTGISEKISQDLWNLLADELAENIKKGNITVGFTTIIEKCGQLLSENFPAKEDNPNELKDGLVILEDDIWY